MAKIQSAYIGRLLMERGLMTEEQFNNCSRIILDAPANGLPQLYIVLMCDEDFMAKLAPIMEPLLEQTEYPDDAHRSSDIHARGTRDADRTG